MSLQRDVAIRYALEYTDKGLARAITTTRQLEQQSQKTGTAVAAAARRQSDQWKLLDRQARAFDTDTTRRSLAQASAVSRGVDRQVSALKKLGVSYTEIGRSMRAAGASAEQAAGAINKAAGREQEAIARLARARETLSRPVRMAGAAVSGSGSAVAGGGRRLTGAIGGAIGFGASALIGGLSVAAIKTAVEQTAQLAKQAQILSHYTGMSKQSAFELEAVASAYGVSSKSLGMGFKTLATQVNTNLVHPTKSSMQAFKELGITQNDLKAHSHDLMGMFELVADRLNKLPPGAARTALAAKLLGRSWQSLAPLIEQGSKGMKQQTAEAKALGVSLGGNAAQNMEKLHDASIKLKLAQLGLSVQFSEHVAPSLIKVTEWGIKLATAVGHDLTPAFRTITPILKDVGQWLTHHKDVVRDVVLAYAGFKIIKTVGGLFGGLFNDVKRVTSVFSALGTVSKEGVKSLFAQRSETTALTLSNKELAGALERVAIAQKEVNAGGGGFSKGGAPAVVTGAGGARGAAGAASSAERTAATEAAAAEGGFAGVASKLGAFGIAFAAASPLVIGGIHKLQDALLGSAADVQQKFTDKLTAAGNNLPQLTSLGTLARQFADKVKAIDPDLARKMNNLASQAEQKASQLARQQIGGITQSMSGARTTTQVLQGVLPGLNRLPGQFQNAGALAVIKFALGMQSKGQLPRGATDKLIHDLEARYPRLASYLQSQGASSMRLLADQFRVNRVQGNAIGLINQIHKTFTFLPTYAQTAGSSTQQKMATAMTELQTIIRTGTKKQADAARPELARLVANYGSYLDTLGKRTQDSLGHAGKQWVNFGNVVIGIHPQLATIQNAINNVANAANKENLSSARSQWSGFGSTLTKQFPVLGQLESAIKSITSVARSTNLSPANNAWSGFGSTLSAQVPVLGQLQSALQSVISIANQAGSALAGVHAPPGGKVSGTLTFNRKGGWIVPGSPSQDGTLAWLSGDEAVITGPGQKMMDREAPGLLRRVIRNQLPHFAAGGLVHGKKKSSSSSSGHMSAKGVKLEQQGVADYNIAQSRQTHAQRDLDRSGVDPQSKPGLQYMLAAINAEVHDLNKALPLLRKARTDAHNHKDWSSQGRLNSEISSAADLLDQATADQAVTKRAINAPAAGTTSTVDPVAQAEAAAQAIVDVATHGETLAQTGLANLQLKEQLAGTFGTPAGAAQVSNYIKQNIEPAIKTSITALQGQLKTAQAVGDVTLANQIAEAIASKQNDLLTAQLEELTAVKDAAQQTAQNTSQLGGQVGVDFENQTFGSLAGVLNGA